MLKRIPKSDISIRPFKAYKQWSFESGSTQVSLLEADISSSDLSGLYPKNSIHGQLRAQFYNGLEDNPFMRVGAKSLEYETASAVKERYLGDYAKVIAIPQIYVGDGIKKGSVVLLDNGTEFIDDTFGNLIGAAGDKIIFTNIDLQLGTGTFIDIALNTYNVTFPLSFWDVNSTKMWMYYNGNLYSANIVSFNIESGEMIADNISFLAGAAGTDKIGNVFYNQGLVVITRQPENALNSIWSLDYKSTETIYEHEYLLIVNQDEFNVSQNPSAVVEVGKQTDVMIDSNGRTYKVVTNPGTKYIRKKSILENGNELDYRYTSSLNATAAGFEHYELSSSVDTTGSFLTPFITTIGLYDDNCDLVAVAKLPQPIKSEHDIPVNFIVRFDT